MQQRVARSLLALSLAKEGLYGELLRFAAATLLCTDLFGNCGQHIWCQSLQLLVLLFVQFICMHSA